MNNPCDECRKNKYCSKTCKKARDYQKGIITSIIFKNIFNKKEKEDEQ